MSSIVSVSPSFSSHSFNSLSDIADRVVQELRSENSLNDDEDDFFDFSSDDNDVNNANNRTKTAEENDESEFEFPVVSGELKPNSSDPISPDPEILSSESQIWHRYPLFDRSLLSDCSEIEPCPTPVARLSLKKLFSEERDSPSSSSTSSEADDLERVTPGSYCVWKPKIDQQSQIGSQSAESRGRHKKSYSIGNNISKRWKVRDLLKRSYSDDNYSTGNNGNAVVVLSPTIATTKKIEKSTTDNEKVSKKMDKTIKVSSSSSSTKTENNIPVNKSKAAGGHRRPPYAPYRQDQLTLFAHFNGSSRNLYRY